jgi:hypothetical protein
VAALDRLRLARCRHLLRLWAADRRYLTLVRALARPCRRHLLGRQLSCRHRVAAGDQPFH